MSLKLPPLKALRAFEAAARAGSYVEAAEELSVTPAAISQQVRNLEAYFSRQLFTRYNNRILLTDAGTKIYTNLGPPLLDLAQKNRQLLEGPTAAHLVVSLLPSLAQTWFIPLLVRFSRQYPHIGIHTRVEEDPVDIARNDIDLRVTYGSLLYTDFDSRKLFHDSVLPMCSPDFAEQYSLNESNLGQLPDQCFIHTVWGDNFASHPTWSEWFRHKGIERDPSIANGQQFSMSSVGLEYASHGPGVLLGQRRLAEEQLRQKRLILLAQEPLALGQAYFAIFPRAGRQSGLVNSLLDQLAD